MSQSQVGCLNELLVRHDQFRASRGRDKPRSGQGGGAAPNSGFIKVRCCRVLEQSVVFQLCQGIGNEVLNFTRIFDGKERLAGLILVLPVIGKADIVIEISNRRGSVGLDKARKSRF